MEASCGKDAARRENCYALTYCEHRGTEHNPRGKSRTDDSNQHLVLAGYSHVESIAEEATRIRSNAQEYTDL
jgi:hypothetical protein